MLNIKKILGKHQKWLSNEAGGKRADLSGANLSGANLSWADLSGAKNIDSITWNICIPPV